MDQQNILQLAKQGNVKAISALMNRSLQPKGMTVVKAALKDGCLQIMLEAAQVPEQQALVAFVRKGINSLEPESIKQVKVHGRQIGEKFPAWSQEFETGSVGKSAQLKPSIPRTDTAVVGFVSDPPTPTVEQERYTTPEYKKNVSGIGEKIFGSLAIFGGIIFCLTGIGIIFGIPAILLGWGMMFDSESLQGLCPYCGGSIMTATGIPGVNCSACKKRIVIRERKFYSID